MGTVVWALLGLTAICGTSWSFPVGVTTIDTNEQIHVSESSSSSEENVINIIEATLIVTHDVDVAALEGSKDQTSHEEAKPITEDIEESVSTDEGVEHEGGESPVEHEPTSSLRSTIDYTEVEEGEETNTEVSDS